LNRDEIHFPPHHVPLREDIHALGEVVGAVLREQGGDALYGLAEGDRRLAIRCRGEGAVTGLDARVQGREPALARDLVRAFHAFFLLANVAEKVHRVRRRREYYRVDSARAQPQGVLDAVLQLQAQGLGLDDVLRLLKALSIEPVLLAHPTESARRTGLRRQQRIADLLLERSNPLLAPHEQARLLARIRAEVTIDWQTAEHPRERLTVADEREHAIFYLGEVLYRVVPAFYEELSRALAQAYGADAERIELPVLLRFRTGVGGDMEGAADIHAKSIRETLARQQRAIIGNYLDECRELAQRLSQSAGRVGVAPALLRRIGDYRTLLPGSQSATPARHDPMPYREFLGQVGERLRNTFEGRPNGYERPAQFRADVAMVAESLRDNNGLHAGYFAVRRLLLRIDTFGFHLATLDLRQRAAVHDAVLAQGLAEPDWARQPPAVRLARLADVLQRDAAPLRAFDALGRRTLAVFEGVMQARHRYGEDAVGLYTVTGASCGADVVAPVVLAHWAGARDRQGGAAAIDVAPLFDSVDSLGACGAIMRELLDTEAYRRHLAARARVQTVQIGYSESSRDSGMLASRVAAYRAQRALTEELDRARDDHVLAYARGGSIPRGGGRIDALLRAAPAETVSGTLQYTEQGEGIAQDFGLRPNAIRTLERAFSTLALATLAVRRGVAPRESQAFADCAAELAARARSAWLELTQADGFLAYFRAATPIDVIERMRIGARLHQAHAPAATVAEVPAAAWVHAWSQSRHMLPGWYGAGLAFEAAGAARGLELLKRAYRGWPFFRALVDDIEAMLARTDLRIAACYDELAGAAAGGFPAQLRAEHGRAMHWVCAIKQVAGLLDGEGTLQRSIELRNPYVDPMNLMQVDLLRRWRAGGRDDPALFEALLASVGGIGAGLQTAG
jgi:phosphoenolpyruvate carboxylase